MPIDPGEEPLGLIYLGSPGPVAPKPGERNSAASFVRYLD